jgi:hypothetical protein
MAPCEYAVHELDDAGQDGESVNQLQTRGRRIEVCGPAARLSMPMQAREKKNCWIRHQGASPAPPWNLGNISRINTIHWCKVRPAVELGKSDSECPHTDLSHDHLTCYCPSHPPLIRPPRLKSLYLFRPTLKLPPSRPSTPSSPSKPTAR